MRAFSLPRPCELLRRLRVATLWRLFGLFTLCDQRRSCFPTASAKAPGDGRSDASRFDPARCACGLEAAGIEPLQDVEVKIRGDGGGEYLLRDVSTGLQQVDLNLRTRQKFSRVDSLIRIERIFHQLKLRHR